MTRRIYLASSWRNAYQPGIVVKLRAAGHEVYDFRNPAPGDNGFHWSEIDPSWKHWGRGDYRAALKHPIAKRCFASDWEAMQWADTGVLLLPCGRSAHLEAGYFAGAGKSLHILLYGELEPELMYKMADSVCLELPELLTVLAEPAHA